MNIPQSDITNAINGIVEFFARRIKTVQTKPEFLKLQDQTVHNLDGIAFLFLGERKITIQVTKAKLFILDTHFHPLPFEPITHAMDCFDEHCLGECNAQFESGDACRHPVQSSDAVGQGGTITCSGCNGLGKDNFDMVTCDDCAGTGRQIYQKLKHDKNCQCLSCQPYGPGLAPLFLTTALIQVSL